MKCLVLGGAGFIGSHLVEALVEKGEDVKVIGRQKNPTNLSHTKNKIKYTQCDLIYEKSILKRAMKGVDVLFLFHTFSTPVSTFNDPIKDVMLNVVETMDILERAGKSGIKKVIFPSSGTVYGDVENKVDEEAPTNPSSPYGISKLMIEKYLKYYKKKYNMDYKILRYSNVYGERQNANGNFGVIPKFFDKIINNEKPTVFGDGSAVRDYIYIKDAVDATMLVALKKSKHNIFNISSEEGNSTNDLLSIMSHTTGKTISVMKKPGGKSLLKKIILDNGRIREEFKWHPATTICAGIKKMWGCL